MRPQLGPILTWLLLATCGAPASAVTLGMVDTFQGGTTASWGSGSPNPNPPTVVAGGGPAGLDDSFMLLSATGQIGPGSKLVAMNGAQWTGDYLAAGVSAVAMDLVNLGGTALSLRLALAGPLGTLVSTQAVNLPAGGGWTRATFAVDAGSLSGGAPTTLSSVSELRLFHSATNLFPGPAVAAQLGVDNISAVPEPGTWALWLAALALGGASQAARRCLRH